MLPLLAGLSCMTYKARKDEIMDIYNFFNSPDVADHCRSIGHTFNAVESAVMISQSNNRTLAEKHAAYRIIIAEYPDMEIPEGMNHGYVESFHKMLRDIIACEESELEKFLAPDPNSVYRVKLHRKNKDMPRDMPDELFLTYQDALDDALALGGDYPDAMYYSIQKVQVTNNTYISMRVSLTGDIMGIYQYNYNHDEPSNRLRDKLLGFLESCYIDVPIPFKKGDLLEVYDGGWMGDVYVLQSTCRDDANRNAKNILEADITDMWVCVYYASGSAIACETMYFYPNLRYCRRELVGEERILKYVSLYMKDELCLCHLLDAQKYFLADGLMSKVNGSMGYDMEELLKLAKK